MAIELITCGACGAKNASSRTVCLSCKTNLTPPKEERTSGQTNMAGDKATTKQPSELTMREFWLYVGVWVVLGVLIAFIIEGLFGPWRLGGTM